MAIELMRVSQTSVSDIVLYALIAFFALLLLVLLAIASSVSEIYTMMHILMYILCGYYNV